MFKDIEKFFGTKKEGELPSIIKQPFIQECITDINMRMHRNCFNKNEVKFSATIYFENGNTRGEQEIEANNFFELYQKVYNFCMSL